MKDGVSVAAPVRGTVTAVGVPKYQKAQHSPWLKSMPVETLARKFVGSAAGAAAAAAPSTSDAVTTARHVNVRACRIIRILTTPRLDDPSDGKLERVGPA